MDPVTGVLASFAGRLAGEAARPLTGRLRRELVKRKIAKPRDVSGILAQVSGVHRGEINALGLVAELPAGVTYAQLKEVASKPTFTALTRQLIAVHLCADDDWRQGENREERAVEDLGQPWKEHGNRIEEAMRVFFAESLAAEESPQFLSFFRSFYATVDKSCRETSVLMKKALAESHDGFTWASQTLALPILASIERHAFLVANPERASKKDGDRWRKDYVESFRIRNEKIELPDLELRTLIHYSEIFVAPALALLNIEHLGDVEGSAVQSPKWKSSFQEFLGELDRTVILGDPGAGKSTMSQVLACKWSEEGEQIAFLLKVRQMRFRRNGFNVVTEIERVLTDVYQKPAPPGMVEELLLNGSALVIFDGLDELPVTVRGRDVSEVIEAAGMAYPLTRILVTSRRLGYSAVRLDQEIFCDYVLQPFTDDQVEEYSTKWFTRRTRTGHHDKTVPQLVANFMEHSDTIPDLRENPLMLAVICLLHAGYNEIPRSRPKIYKKCVELLLRTWDSHRGIGESTWDLEAFEVVLAEIAYNTLLKPEYRDGVTEPQVLALATENLLGEAVPDAAKARQLARRMLALCRGRAWMFTDMAGGAPGEERFSFTHQSFQEYFAAQYLVRHAETSEEVATEIRTNIAAGRLEIFSQICLSLAGEKFPYGASKVYTHCLKAEQASPPSRRNAVIEFLAKSSDIVMLNGSALQLVADGVISTMTRVSGYSIAKHLMRWDFRHADAIQRMIGDSLLRLDRESPVTFAQTVLRHPWIWEICLREGLVDLDTRNSVNMELLRLYEGSLYTIRGGGAACTATWLFGRMASPTTDAAVVDRCLRILEGLTAQARYRFETSEPPIPPYTLFQPEERVVGNLSRSLLRSSRYSPEAASGLAYLAMAFCEIVVEHQPQSIDVIRPVPVVGDFLWARRSANSERLPRGMSRLNAADVHRIRSWADGDTSLFNWDDPNVVVS
ncbi:NACHT domain-containing protein [Streptomyces sp. H39-S7]|uniref:NACHT domain-containing protein n=1 Tax=Streptomyces sp. H39-S7 TaxID=3004357 RepID=UPI0022B05640|nr:NACHT domain-containing protein [Streptomyces sp. H39-S7]MCZ4118153.1 NACHT domain-containing protein [Streptomyces sp. H39-S7]